jgi:hypothetical protein
MKRVLQSEEIADESGATWGEPEKMMTSSWHQPKAEQVFLVFGQRPIGIGASFCHNRYYRLEHICMLPRLLKPAAWRRGDVVT